MNLHTIEYHVLVIAHAFLRQNYSKLAWDDKYPRALERYDRNFGSDKTDSFQRRIESQIKMGLTVKMATNHKGKDIMG